MKIEEEESVEKSKSLKEISLERENIISVRVLFLTMFLSSVGFSITLPSIWPYLKVLDAKVTKKSLGIVVAIFSIGQLFGGIIFGLAINQLESFRKPLIASITFMFFGNLFYSYLANFKQYGKSFLILSRFIVGFGSGNVAITRTFVTAFSKPEEKTAQVALMSAFQGLGFIFGPCIQTSFIPLGYPGAVNEQYFALNMFTAAGFMGAITSIVNIVLLLIYFYDRSPYAKYANTDEINVEAAILKKLLEKSRFGELSRTVMTLGKSVNAMESFLNRPPIPTKRNSPLLKGEKVKDESVFIIGMPATKFEMAINESIVSSDKVASSENDLSAADIKLVDSKKNYINPTNEIEKEYENTFFQKAKDANSRFAFLKDSFEEESQPAIRIEGNDFQDNGLSIVAIPQVIKESNKDTESTFYNKDESIFKSFFDTNISEVMTQMLIHPSERRSRRIASFPQTSTVYSSYLFSIMGSFVALILNNSAENSIRSGTYGRWRNSLITKSEFLSSMNSTEKHSNRTQSPSFMHSSKLGKINDLNKSEYRSSLGPSENHSNHSLHSVSVCRSFVERIRGKSAEENEVVCCPQQPGKVDFLGITIVLSVLFSSMVLFSSLETILTPMLMDNFAFELTYASLIASLDLASCGIMGIFIYIGIGFSTKRYSNRVHMVVGQIFCTLTCFVLIPMVGKPPIPKTNGTTGCPVTEQLWCKTTSALTIYALLISLFTFTLGYAICSVVTTVLFSLALGPGSQALWMGFFTAVGSLSRIVGPFFVTSVYAFKGLPLVFGILLLFNVILLWLIFWFYNRIVSFKPK